MGCGKCPRADELEALLKAPDHDSAVGRHVDACPLCTSILQALRDEAQLLAELRQAARAGLDQDTRLRIQEICARLVPRT